MDKVLRMVLYLRRTKMDSKKKKKKKNAAGVSPEAIPVQSTV